MKRDVFAIEMAQIPNGSVYWIMRDDGEEICSCVLNSDPVMALQELGVGNQPDLVMPDFDTLMWIQVACPDGYSITWVTLENRKENERWQATAHMRAEVINVQS